MDGMSCVTLRLCVGWCLPLGRAECWVTDIFLQVPWFSSSLMLCYWNCSLLGLFCLVVMPSGQTLPLQRKPTVVQLSYLWSSKFNSKRRQNRSPFGFKFKLILPSGFINDTPSIFPSFYLTNRSVGRKGWRGGGKVAIKVDKIDTYTVN